MQVSQIVCRCLKLCAGVSDCMQVPQRSQNIVTFNYTVTKHGICAVIPDTVLFALNMTCLDYCQLLANV
jgi:hypothetical protein